LGLPSRRSLPNDAGPADQRIAAVIPSRKRPGLGLQQLDDAGQRWPTVASTLSEAAGRARVAAKLRRRYPPQCCSSEPARKLAACCTISIISRLLFVWPAL
jgi:hypothetical protein